MLTLNKILISGFLQMDINTTICTDLASVNHLIASLTESFTHEKFKLLPAH